jgi:hypothetical protein
MALFVGPFLLLGIYGKMVKQYGSDAATCGQVDELPLAVRKRISGAKGRWSTAALWHG